MELHVLAAHLRGGEVTTALAAGWGGDRFRVYEAPEGPAMVWWKVWDTETAARRFRVNTGRRLTERIRAGYRTAVDSTQVAGRPAVRTVIAPTRWDGWDAVPGCAWKVRGET